MKGIDNVQFHRNITVNAVNANDASIVFFRDDLVGIKDFPKAIIASGSMPGAFPHS